MKRVAPGKFRNQKCYCGSNLKYKKCHYIIDSEANQAYKEAFLAAREQKIKDLEKIKE